MRLDLLEEEATAKPEPVARENSILPPAKPVNAPEIREIDKERFEALRNASAAETHNGTEQTSERDEPAEEPDLLSFAAITDDPEPEVAAAGHDRTIINIKPEHVDAWLSPDPRDLASLYAIFDDRRHPFYEHRIAA